MTDYPQNWDWSSRAFVLDQVKNQTDGRTSSWAYAVTNALEAMYGIKYNKQGDFSVQQLLDCTPSEVKQGFGSFVDLSLLAIAESGGIAWEQYYPFRSGQAETCYYNLSIPAV